MKAQLSICNQFMYVDEVLWMFGTIFSFFCFLLFMFIMVFSIGYALLSPYFGYVLYKKVIIVDKHISKILVKEKNIWRDVAKFLLYICATGFVFVCSFVVFSVVLLLMYLVFVL